MINNSIIIDRGRLIAPQTWIYRKNTKDQKKLIQ